MKRSQAGCRRVVPATGRAHDKSLCCKHDRILYGRQTLEEKGTKILMRQIERLKRELLRREEKK